MKHARKAITFLRVTAITLTAIMAVQFFAVPVNASFSTKTLKVCLIFPTTGGLGSIGDDEIRGATIAIKQANAILATGTSGIQFAAPPPSADSGTAPTQADNAWKNLVNVQGCQATVGAAGSGEISGFLADANAAKVPTISPSSTAASLAIAGDMLFRTPGNDLAQAPASAALVYAAGVRHLAIIARQDPYGTSLRDGIKAAFLAKSGTDVADTSVTTYDPTSISAAQAATDTLNGQVTTLLGTHTANTIGVVIIAFEDDGNAIFNRARTETNLPKVLWFGTDGIGGSNAFIPPNQCGSGCGTGSVAVSTFMATKANVTGSFPTSPILGTGGTQIANLAYNGTVVPKRVGLADSGIVNLTGTGYFSIYGLIPQPYWDYAYDAAVIQMLAILKANSYVGANIAAQIITVANQTVGATGLLSLALTGDRAKQFYIFYGYNYLAPKNGTCCFAWDFSGGHGFFNPDTGTIVGTRPTASESGGQIWTSELQDLAAAATFDSTSMLTCGNSNCAVISNSTIASTSFNSGNHTLIVTFRGTTGTVGFANVTVPKSDVFNSNPNSITVFRNGTQLSNSAVTITSNATDFFVYVTFTFHSGVRLEYLFFPLQSQTLPPYLGVGLLLLIVPVVLTMRTRIKNRQR